MLHTDWTYINRHACLLGNLRAHMLRLHSVPHVDETVYRCSNCSCVFRKLGSLNAHMNRMHQPVNEVWFILQSLISVSDFINLK